MKNNDVQCPHCQKKFQLSEKITNSIIISVREDLAKDLLEKELECTQRIEKAKSEVREITRQEVNLNLLGKEKLINDLKDQLTKIRQKLDDSSQQLVGEVQELALEAILANAFTLDNIVPVAKGIKGADCSQHVMLPSGIEIGKIIYESKRVKSFSDAWVSKLKKDNLNAKCDIAVIVTSVLPPSIKGKFGMIDGIWICQFDPESIKQLATVLRYSLLKIYQFSLSQKDSETKADKLYMYVNSQDFANLMESVLDGYKNIEQTYQDEKKKLLALWKLRELHLKEMLQNTVEMYATMRGIEPTIQTIESLEFRQAD